MHTITDEELVSNYLKTKNNDYYGQLYKRYSPKVFRKCLSMTNDKMQAEDLTQDVFLRLMAKLDDYKQQAKFSTWLYSITYNCCIDHIRRTRWRQNLSSIESCEDVDLIADTDLSTQPELLSNQMQQALLHLTDSSQHLLRQKYQYNVSIRDLANQQSLTESAIKMRLKRSREQLRQIYRLIAAY